LSALLEAHYGKPYPRIAAERIIEKLGLKGTWLGAANVPKGRLVQSYIGKDGRLERDPDIAWPDYSFGHASLYLTLEDLTRFLRAVRTGELVGKASLQKLWQPQMLASHMRGDFATGWEYGESGAYRQVGHDGGARVRVRMLFKDSLDGDCYTFIYLTNGSAKNVWSRTLIDSVMAVVAPKAFPLETLSEELIGFALQLSDAGRATALANEIRENSPFKGSDLERAVNTIGYSVKGNLGIDAAIRIFALNTQLFPKSANTWDSLAETYKAQGDDARAQSFYEKAKQLSARAGK
jgi:D-alanyl-D-alanine carboxypeptidase